MSKCTTNWKNKQKFHSSSNTLYVSGEVQTLLPSWSAFHSREGT